MPEQPDPKFTENGSSNLPWICLAVSAVAMLLIALMAPQFIWLALIAFLATVYLAWGKSVAGSEGLENRTLTLEHTLEDDRLSQAVVEAMQHPVLIVDEKASLLYANGSSVSVFGPLNIGEQIFIRFRQPELRQVIEQVLRSGESTKFEYNEAIPGDRWFSLEISPVAFAVGAQPDVTTRFVLTFHDLTETKRIDQMRSDFIANASHELRTPLASLSGYLETLQGPAKDDPKASKRFIKIMLEQAERMSRLVNDLLSLSRIEMKSHLRPSDAVDVSEIVSSVVSALEPLSERMGVRIELNIENKFMINGDRDELVQVFENIIENACKYGQDGEVVKVTVAAETVNASNRAVVTVQDFGPGIAMEHQHRITERFYRVDVARSREKQGTGLGLAIVKHILQRHGTRLTVKSKPDEGASFIVQFAIVDSGKN